VEDGMKPIEKGCKAVIVNTVHGVCDGKIVVVQDYLGELDFIHIGINRAWLVDRGLKAMNGGVTSHVPEFMLLRIDDDDKEELSSWEHDTFKELGWNPTKIGEVV